MHIKIQKIFFDFDSTLIRKESLDMLGELCGVGAEVKRITDLTMSGQAPMDELFRQKIDLMSPKFRQVQAIAQECPNWMVPNAKEVIRVLQRLGKEVFILSSNFKCLINRTADILHIDRDHVLANEMYFDENENYAGFNYASPLSGGSGKAKIISMCKKESETVAMIGDGSTDLRTKDVVDLFIGFGGVEARPNVRDGSDYYVNEHDLAYILPIILDGEEMQVIRQTEYQHIIPMPRTTTTTKTTKPPNSG